MNLNQWAIRWGVSFEAVEDLRREMGAISTEPDTMENDKPESFVQTAVRLEASKKGLPLSIMQPSSRGSQAYDALLTSLLTNHTNTHLKIVSFS